jgi:hypothetical protein
MKKTIGSVCKSPFSAQQKHTRIQQTVYMSAKKHSSDPNCARDLFYRHLASQRNKESSFFAALAHAIKDRHIDPFGCDQWYLPLVLTTVLAWLFLRRWELVLLLFSIYYLLEYLFFFIMRVMTRKTTADITARHRRFTELLTDPLVFVFSVFTAWYLIDYTVIGDGVGGPAQWWRSAIIIGVSLLSGHARAYWLTLALLIGAIWVTHVAVLLSSSSEKKHDYAVWLSLRATGFTLFFYAAFLVPIGGHFLQNALLALLLALFFGSAIHAISLN